MTKRVTTTTSINQQIALPTTQYKHAPETTSHEATTMMMAPISSPNSIGALRSTSNNNAASKAPPVQKYLTNCKSLYSCIYCRTQLANHDELVSRSFQGNHGRAYLFNSVINVSCGQAVQRELNTGSHAVADIFCGNCRTTLGWKYEKAYVETQKYKEGKYIIELAHVVRENKHLELDKGETMFFGRDNRHRHSSSITNRSSTKHNHFNQRHQSSLTPPSLGHHWSSPTGSSSNEEVGNNRDDDDDGDDVDVDEELMFPFYDDLCANRSSYPSNLSSSQHNRMRRSLYLDSTPYDWKQSTPTSSSSSSPPDAGIQQATASPLNSSLGSFSQSSSTSPPSISSSSASSSSNTSPGCDVGGSSQQSYRTTMTEKKPLDSDCNYNNNKSSKTSERFKREDEENDTQFEFEADRPDVTDVESAPKQQFKQSEKCDQLTSGIMKVTVGYSGESSNSMDRMKENSSENSTAVSSELSSATNYEAIPRKTSSDNSVSNGNDDNNVENDSADQNRAVNSINVDDEEFYDCCTEHDIQNLMVASSDSCSTLKVVE